MQPAKIVSLFVVKAFDKAALDARPRIGQLLATIILNALTPYTLGTFSVKAGNAGPSRFGKVDSNSTTFVE